MRYNIILIAAAMTVLFGGLIVLAISQNGSANIKTKTKIENSNNSSVKIPANQTISPVNLPNQPAPQMVDTAQVSNKESITNGAIMKTETVPTPQTPKETIPQTKAVLVNNDLFNGEKIVKSEIEWRKSLTPMQYYVLREKGTEKPFTGKYTNYKQNGTYRCAACDLALFSSKNKYDSGTGWASFYQTIAKVNIVEEIDTSLEETRTEVLCARCHSHLGHVFDDGPDPTGLRYCINSAALNFEKRK